MNPTAHIYLTGYRGTGKTSVAVLVAKQMARPLVDLDLVVEANSGKSIREIFDQGGESMFRRLETEALESVAQMPPAIISLGGGAVLSEENRERIRQTGSCVWLDADAETIAGRLKGDASTADRRPALTDLSEIEEISGLLKQRRTLYDQVSDLRIDTAEKTVQEVASEIIDWAGRGASQE